MILRAGWLAIVVLATMTVSADDDDNPAKSALEKAKALESNGDQVRALRILEEGLGSLTTPQRRSVDGLNLVQKLAMGYQRTGDFPRSVPLLREVLEARQASDGPESPSAADAAYRLGWALLQAKDLAQAEPLLGRAAAFLEKTGERQTVRAYLVQDGLRQVYTASQNPQRALEAAIAAQKAAESSLGEGASLHLASLGSLADALLAQGKFSESEVILKREIDLRRQGEAGPGLLIALDKLARQLRRRGESAQAEPLYRELLAADEQANGVGSKSAAGTALDLGEVLISLGKWNEAEPFLLRAQTSFGPEPTIPAYRCLRDLGSLMNAQNKVARACDYYRQAVPMGVALRGEKSELHVNDLANLGVALSNLKAFEEAERVLIEGREASRSVYGVNRADYALSLDNLAMVYQSTLRPALAKPLHAEAVAVRKATLGEKNWLYGYSLGNLGSTCHSLHQDSEAVPLLRRSLEVQEAAGQTRHMLYGVTFDTLASTLSSIGDHREAASVFEQSAAAKERARGPSDPGALFSLSAAATEYQALSDFARAEAIFLKLLERQRAIGGESSLQSASILQRLASLSNYQGKNLEGRDRATRAVAILEKRLGPPSIELASALETLGDVDSTDQETESRLRRALQIRIDRQGSDHRETTTARWKLAQYRMNRGDIAARKEMDEVLEATRVTLGDGDSVYLSHLALAAAHYHSLGDLVAAERARRFGFERKKQDRGESHPDTISATLGLADLCVSLRKFDEARALIDRVAEVHRQSGKGGDLIEAQILNASGFLHSSNSETALAIDDYQRALKILRTVQGDGHPLVLSSLQTLGLKYTVLLDYPRAEAMFREALAIQERGAGPRSERYAQGLGLLAGLSQQKGDWAEARSLLLKASVIREEIGGKGSRKVADSLLELGKLDTEHGDYARASTELESALAIRTEKFGRDDPRTAEVLDAQAAIFQAKGDPASAKALLVEATAIRRSKLGESHPSYLLGLDALGRFESLGGEPAEAERTIRLALGLRQKNLGPNHPDVARNRLALFSPLIFLGKLAEARSEVEQAVTILAVSPGPRTSIYAGALTNLASVRLQLGDLIEAERILRQARAILRASHESHGLEALETLEQMGSLFGTMGDKAAAQEAILEATNLARSRLGPDHILTALPTVLLAVLSLDRGDPGSEALIVEVERVAEARRNDFPLLQAMAGTVRASSFQKKGDYASAAALHSKAKQIYAQASSRTSSAYLTSLGLEAEALRLSGRPEAAEPLLREEVERTGAALGTEHALFASALGGMATLERTRGKDAAAEPLYRRALEIDRRILDRCFAGLSERRQLAMTDQFRGILDQYLSIGDAASTDRVYDFVVTWKGAVHARQLEIRDRSSRPDLASLYGEAEDASRRLAGLAMTVPENGQADDRVRAIRVLSERVDSLGAEIARRKGPDEVGGRALMARQTARTLSASLPAGVALVDLLEFRHSAPPSSGRGPWSSERRLVAFVSRRDRPVARVELGPVAPVEEALKRWRPDLPQTVTEEARAASAELKRRLWNPLEVALEGASTVLISPDGLAARVPFAALPGRAPDSYLIEDRAIAAIAVPQLLPSLLARSASPRLPEADHLTLVGDVDFGAGGGSRMSESAGRPASPFGDLPGTSAEIDRIAAAWSERAGKPPATILRRERASGSAVRAEASHARILHLATHGFVLPEPSSPTSNSLNSLSSMLPGGRGLSLTDVGQLPAGLRSGLALAGANNDQIKGSGSGDDGIWTALEVAGSDLTHADLVVLSACETGLGQVTGGEGVLGLQRAFQVAGARSVVASLWKVDDLATQALMIDFYRNLWSRQRSRLESLRQAQLSLLQGTLIPKDSKDRGVGGFAPKNPAGGRLPPAYWAGFVLSGDWR